MKYLFAFAQGPAAVRKIPEWRQRCEYVHCFHYDPNHKTIFSLHNIPLVAR